MRPRSCWLAALLGTMSACGFSDCREPRVADPDACVGVRFQPDDQTLPASCTNDEFEPNGDLTLAAAPRDGRDCQMTARSGMLATEADVDVFRTGNCEYGLIARRLEAVAVLDASAEVRLCIFPKCADGSTNVYACYEHTAGDSARDGGVGPTWIASSNSRFRGCCRLGPGPVHAQLDCARLSTRMDLFTWVDSWPPTVLEDRCTPYQVTYGGVP